MVELTGSPRFGQDTRAFPSSIPMGQLASQLTSDHLDDWDESSTSYHQLVPHKNCVDGKKGLHGKQKDDRKVSTK